MGASVRLGRIAGIEIGVNWSWLVIFVLLTWTLASGVFPRQNPDLSEGTHVTMAIAAALLFFVSILLHELGHAFQARREGMEIEGITLWLFGGVAQFRGMFPSAWSELRIAAAGPVVTLVIGIACMALAMAGLPEAVDGVSAWLGYTNFALLAFNLLPALPLDGGRMLRAGLWSRRSFERATRVAGTIGRAIAFGLIGLGLLLFLVAGAFGGAWLAFVGWFLLQASGNEVRSVLARQALDGLRVGDVMVGDPVTVPADLPLDRLVDDVLSRHRYTTYPVVENGRPVGLLPFRSVAAIPRREWSSRTVRECMLPLEELAILGPRERLADALAELDGGGLNRALVLSDGSLAGLLSITDVVRALELRQLSARE